MGYSQIYPSAVTGGSCCNLTAHIETGRCTARKPSSVHCRLVPPSLQSPAGTFSVKLTCTYSLRHCVFMIIIGLAYHKGILLSNFHFPFPLASFCDLIYNDCHCDTQYHSSQYIRRKMHKQIHPAESDHC